ncbi:unnamed protein product [Caenorhabditis angaria]|uniref:Acireductone dioxygenase n=1 Tax=Caenorhabditis angaria TaxID=860376 RepID=A0A9P1N9V3_9PELO|nr:unnamed protein product [Caenorhabditis angaria]
MAYFMCDVGGDIDQRDECRLTPNIDATVEDLKKIGVETTKVNFDDPNVEEDLEKLVRSYDMNHRDEIRICKATMPDFEAKLKIFFEEHLHDDAELRIIKNGVGYFDVRSVDEKWIRIPVRRGDFVFLPAGIYHRFTPDTAEDVTAIRLFRNNPKWTAYNRSADAETQPTRAQYLKEILI